MGHVLVSLGWAVLSNLKYLDRASAARNDWKLKAFELEPRSPVQGQGRYG